MEATPRDARTDWIDSWSFILAAPNEAMALKRSRKIFPPCPCVVHLEMYKKVNFADVKMGQKKIDAVAKTVHLIISVHCLARTGRNVPKCILHVPHAFFPA